MARQVLVFISMDISIRDTVNDNILLSFLLATYNVIMEWDHISKMFYRKFEYERLSHFKHT